MPQIRMKVGGMEYAINSDDDETYVRSIGAQLDRRLDYLAKKNPFLSTTMVAVLAALEAYDAAGKKEQENERLRMEIRQLLEESAMAKMTAAAANRRLEEVLSERAPMVEDKPYSPPVAKPEPQPEPFIDEPEADDLFENQEFPEEEPLDIEEDESGQYGIF